MVLFKSDSGSDSVNSSNTFTFHYGPIQISKDSSTDSHCYDIYIPLWSYSNYKGHCENLGDTYLHSTMVLFKFGKISLTSIT